LCIYNRNFCYQVKEAKGGEKKKMLNSRRFCWEWTSNVHNLNRYVQMLPLLILGTEFRIFKKKVGHQLPKAIFLYSLLPLLTNGDVFLGRKYFFISFANKNVI
jgi:hypothetical protein